LNKNDFLYLLTQESF